MPSVVKILPKETKRLFYVIFNTEFSEFITVLGSCHYDIHRAQKFDTLGAAQSRRQRLGPFDFKIFRVNATYEFYETK